MRSKRMQSIAHIADQQQQEAVQVYVAAQQSVVEAQHQLEQLLDYRIEYSEKRVSCHMSIHQLRDYQLFLDKLNQSIEQAHLQIEHRKQHCEAQRLIWLQTRTRSKALDAVITKYQQQEAMLEARIEQKEQDEFASRILGRRHSQK